MLLPSSRGNVDAISKRSTYILLKEKQSKERSDNESQQGFNEQSRELAQQQFRGCLHYRSGRTSACSVCPSATAIVQVVDSVDRQEHIVCSRKSYTSLDGCLSHPCSAIRISMEVISRNEPNNATPFQHDPNYLALSRMLARYQNLILLTPTPDAKLDARLAPWQKQIQAELWSPLPFHRMKWLRSIEGARSLLLKLEQSAQSIKVQRTRREVVKDLAEKRMVIKRLRSRVEEIGREVEATGTNGYTSQYEDDEESETMYDVLQQIRKSRAQSQSDDGQDAPSQQDVPVDKSQRESTSLEQEGGTAHQQLFDSTSTMRRRQGKEEFNGSSEQGTTSGFSNLPQTEQSLLTSSKEHENITSSLLSMAAQLKQQAKQFEFTLDQDKGLVDRALEGLDSNVAAMGIASKGMKTLQRMSEEQGFFGRLKLQLFIVAMWVALVLLVFIVPKLRF